MATKWRATPEGFCWDSSGSKTRLVLNGPTPGLYLTELDRLSVAGPTLAIESIQVARHREYPVAFSAGALRRVRSASVDVHEPETSACPAAVHSYWRAMGKLQLDLEVLVTTTHEFRNLEAITLSQVAGSELLIPRAGNRWLEISRLGQIARATVFPRDQAAARMTLDGRGPRFGQFALAPPYRLPMVVFRPRDADYSYVEMSHPDDCARVIVRSRAGKVGVTFGLFGLDVEKGVILRGRVRGVFIARADDESEAHKLYELFVKESPNLST